MSDRNIIDFMMKRKNHRL